MHLGKEKPANYFSYELLNVECIMIHPNLSNKNQKQRRIFDLKQRYHCNSSGDYNFRVFLFKLVFDTGARRNGVFESNLNNRFFFVIVKFSRSSTYRPPFQAFTVFDAFNFSIECRNGNPNFCDGVLGSFVSFSQTYSSKTLALLVIILSYTIIIYNYSVV